MKTTISLVIVLVSFTVFANADCRIVEYPDHSEAICIENGDPISASSQRVPEQVSDQDGALASNQAPESELPDVPPEKIVRNGLARSAGSAWLKALAGK